VLPVVRVLFFLRRPTAGRQSKIRSTIDRSCAPFHPSTSWSCVWFAAKALVAIKAALHDPGNVLWDWDLKFGNDPCRWSMVTCQKGQIQELYVLLILCIYGRLFPFCHVSHAVGRSMTNKNLSGTLSPAVGKLRTLRYL
jgi:hypothetical protein